MPIIHIPYIPYTEIHTRKSSPKYKSIFFDIWNFPSLNGIECNRAFPIEFLLQYNDLGVIKHTLYAERKFNKWWMVADRSTGDGFFFEKDYKMIISHTLFSPRDYLWIFYHLIGKKWDLLNKIFFDINDYYIVQYFPKDYFPSFSPSHYEKDKNIWYFSFEWDEKKWKNNIY